MPFGKNAGQMVWQMDYTRLEEADPNELNNLVYMHCKDPELLIYGLHSGNQWKFKPFLEAMSYSKNTIVFYGDAFNEDILNMAENRILYIRSGARLTERWYEEMVHGRDQWIFEIGGNEDMTYMMNTMGVVGLHPMVFAIPRWRPDDQVIDTGDQIGLSKYLYKYLSHAQRMIIAIERSKINVSIGLDLNRILETGNKGDPDYLRSKVGKSGQLGPKVWMNPDTSYYVSPLDPGEEVTIKHRTNEEFKNDQENKST